MSKRGNAQKVIQEWIEISKYDLRTAEAMLETGRYLYVAFMCQQAVEKILKAFMFRRKVNYLLAHIIFCIS